MQKQVFVSYSHDSEEHMAWVKRFADDLQEKGGLLVLLDQDLPKGASLPRFMQQGLMMSDRVLVIGTPNYLKRSLDTGGVAFEESIISNEFMIDIDTTKYYPILREGTFDTAFPPILAGRNGDDFTDDSKYQDKLQVVINEINGEHKEIKLEDVTISHTEHNEAKVTLGVNLLFETIWGHLTGKVEGVGLTVSIVNLCKEPRFFLEPNFEFSDKVFGDKNAFSPINHWPDAVRFPVRLEYGEMVSRTYILPIQSKQLFEQANSKNPAVTLRACAQNTLGNVFYSDSVSVLTIINFLSK